METVLAGGRGGAAATTLLFSVERRGDRTGKKRETRAQVPERQSNYEEINGGLRRLAAAAPPAFRRAADRLDAIHQFDHVFWMGDLNYRIDAGNHGTEDEFHATLAKVAADDHGSLREHDQLTKERDRAAVFCPRRRAEILPVDVLGEDSHSNAVSIRQTGARAAKHPSNRCSRGQASVKPVLARPRNQSKRGRDRD